VTYAHPSPPPNRSRCLTKRNRSYPCRPSIGRILCGWMAYAVGTRSEYLNVTRSVRERFCQQTVMALHRFFVESTCSDPSHTALPLPLLEQIYYNDCRRRHSDRCNDRPVVAARPADVELLSVRAQR